MMRHVTEGLQQLQQYYFKKPIKEDVVQLLSNNFLLVSATMLRFLSQFTKTDAFLSAIEGLS